MSNAVVFTLLFQFLEPSPRQVEVGETATVRVTDSRGAPVPAVPVRLLLPDAGERDVGTTDAQGETSVRVDRTGDHVVVAEAFGVRLLAPLRVTERTPRLWFALIATPVALVLAWLGLRGIAADRRRPVVDQATRPSPPGPSRPAP